MQRLRDDSPEVMSGQSSYEMTPTEVEDAQPASATRTLRLARTIADLEGADSVRRLHLAEALAYRRVAVSSVR